MASFSTQDRYCLRVVSHVTRPIDQEDDEEKRRKDARQTKEERRNKRDLKDIFWWWTVLGTVNDDFRYWYWLTDDDDACRPACLSVCVYCYKFHSYDKEREMDYRRVVVASQLIPILLFTVKHNKEREFQSFQLANMTTISQNFCFTNQIKAGCFWWKYSLINSISQLWKCFWPINNRG